MQPDSTNNATTIDRQPRTVIRKSTTLSFPPTSKAFEGELQRESNFCGAQWIPFLGNHRVEKVLDDSIFNRKVLLNVKAAIQLNRHPQIVLAPKGASPWNYKRAVPAVPRQEQTVAVTPNSL